MIKVITCIKRKPGMSVEDFQAYWRTDHAEVVKGLPNLRRYIQSHALPGGYRKGELPYDGIAEIWVDDVDTLRANAGGAAYEAIQRDEENFIDRPNMATILTQEYIIKDSPIPKGAVKNIEFVPERPAWRSKPFKSIGAMCMAPSRPRSRLSAAMCKAIPYGAATAMAGCRPGTAAPSPGSTMSRPCGNQPRARPMPEPGRTS